MTPAEIGAEQRREEAAELAALAEYREWQAAGEPGAAPHEEVMAELLRGSHARLG